MIRRITSGGAHLYFRPPAGVRLRNSAGALGWKIDTRAHGGYVVTAGSVRAQGIYRISRLGPIAELPGWLAAALTPPPRAAPSNAPLGFSPRRAGAYLQAVIEGEAAGIAAAQTGTRHRVRLKAARNLGRLVGGGELDEQTAYDALRDAAVLHIGNDCTEAEVDNDLRDGLAYGQRLPRRITQQEANPA
ncbi:MAG: bifunctional DNA primase/polymerase [Pseudonocardia sp.]